MKIYTSYFGNLKKLNEAGIYPVGVARWKPRFYSGAQMLNLAPTPYMLKQATDEEYLKMYDDILNNQNASKIVNMLSYLSGGRDVALLCYEKPGDFCHRHLIAKWLNKNGYDVKEFGEVIEIEKKPEAVQTSLF